MHFRLAKPQFFTFKNNVNMKKKFLLTMGLTTSFCFGFILKSVNTIKPNEVEPGITKVKPIKIEPLKLGAFSVSLSVKDIKASQHFYENLGFSVYAGDMEKNFLIMKSGDTVIGLFYGMFEKTILTFNPGWDQNASNLETYDDIREIQKQLKQKGIPLETEVDENSTGPASFIITDPDGNVLLFDQHI